MKKRKKEKKKNRKNPKILKGIIKITTKPLGFVIVERLASSTHHLRKVAKSKESYGETKSDIIVFEENLNCALDKDEVEVEIIGHNRERNKGRITRIIRRNKTNFVGTLENLPAGEKPGLVFIPDDWKFYRKIEIRTLPKEAKVGEKMLVKIKDWNNPDLNPTGEIIKIIGKKGEHETEMQSILLDKGIVYDFPAEVEREANEIAEKFLGHASSLSPISLSSSYPSPVSDLPAISTRQARRKTRVEAVRGDFRNVITFTIDPADAKDFDDALSYEKLSENKIRVGVHIADVSHFVRPGTAIDREAKKRSFSTYLVDRTIPMLPEILSNDLCSLKPNVDRLAFSAVFDIKKDTGEILNRWFGKTIINSNKRFSYEEAQKILDDESPTSDVGLTLHPMLGELNRLAKIYMEENKKNGAIEFETDEVKFEFDEKGKPIKIYKKERLGTMKMIEGWMLLANKEVAKFISDKLSKRGGFSIFRVHSLPKMERIEELAIFVRALGHNLPIKNGEVSAKDINILLKQIEGHASESLIKTATIRSMAKAEYSTKNIGHFGLAFQYYTHFTSPIRRYPDLIIHRILSQYLNSEKNNPKVRRINRNEFTTLTEIAEEASEKEIIVSEAERESIKYKQVEFMQNKVGQIYNMVISGVTEWGMYVEDSETKIEGLVRIKDLSGDYFKLDQKNYCIKGERTKKKYSVGDIIKVKLVSTDLERKTLDFKLV